MWSQMGVLDRSTWFARGSDTESYPYRCMSCQAALPVQYHSCPECESYDIRAAKWVDE
jgi:rRNA maturation endonuclease Nob1